MKPGRELDKLVAMAVGWRWDGGSAWSPNGGRSSRDRPDSWWWLPYYSTDWAAAGQAWEWLQKNIPGEWTQVLECMVYLLVLTDYDGPTVMLIQDTDYSIPSYQERIPEYPYNWYISGESYPHAIALAVIEAAKVK